MENNKEYNTLILGALLHDIGKFIQRSEEWTKNHWSHPQISAYFVNPEKLIDDIKDKDVKISEKYNLKNWITSSAEIDEQLLYEIAKYHHEKDLDKAGNTINKLLCEIISEADNLSSGEREESENCKKDQPFESIFNQISLEKENKKTDNNKHYFSIRPLNIKEFEFPKEKISAQYTNQWNEFIKEFNFFVEKSNGLKIKTIYYLLKKYLWCVPCGYYKQETDISLFEHLKTTAAIAVCLYKYLIETGAKVESGKEREVIKDRKQNRYLFICGDLSGIQKFIYSISSKGAGKSLKGRSFYLQLLSDSISQYLLTELKLPITNMLYSSGGKFYILAPNTEECRKKISECKTIINKFLLKKFGSQIYAAIGYSEISGESFCKGNDGKYRISEVWRDVNVKVSEDKSRKFADYISTKEGYDDLFGVKGMGGKENNCSVCGNEFNERRKNVKTESENKVCEECDFFEELGKNLKSFNILICAEQDFEIENALPVKFNDLNLSYYLLENLKTLQFPSINKKISIFNVNYTDNFVNGFIEFENVECGFRFYGGNYLPMKNYYEPKTFNDFCDNSIQRMAVLRMDVDNLGQIFIKGFGDNNTISRITQLSFMMDFFFSGLINKIISENEWKDSVSIIYSGGDDLFLVGDWNIICECGLKIRMEFARYCGFNKNLSLSAGIFLAADKYPLYKSATDCEEYEKMAKNFCFGDEKIISNSKNAVTFLGLPMNWDDFEKIKNFKDMLVNGISNKQISKGLLNKLMETYLLYIDTRKSIAKKQMNREELERLAFSNKWQWKMVYYLHRFIQNEKSNTKIIEDIENIILHNSNEFKTKQEFISLLGAPTRWAEFETRN